MRKAMEELKSRSDRGGSLGTAKTQNSQRHARQQDVRDHSTNHATAAPIALHQTTGD